MKLGNAKINKNTKRYQNETIYNGNKTEWSTIRPVIIGVVHKIRRLRSFEVLINNTTMGFWGLRVLRGDLCKSGPGHFASEKRFPSNFT